MPSDAACNAHNTRIRPASDEITCERNRYNMYPTRPDGRHPSFRKPSGAKLFVDGKRCAATTVHIQYPMGVKTPSSQTVLRANALAVQRCVCRSLLPFARVPRVSRSVFLR